MKINKKIIVSSMALSMGAALAGSVSGTIAWYQYSTRSTVAMVGTSVGAERNLEVKIGSGEWKSDLKIADVAAYLATDNTYNKGDKLIPLTAGASEKDDEIPQLYRNPVYQHTGMTTWEKAKNADYVLLPLSVRYVSKDGVNDPTYPEKDIYLHNVSIIDGAKPSDNEKEDISDAVRVSIVGDDVYANISKKGGELNTFGTLDLNGDGKADKAEHYEWEDESDDIVYGVDGSKEETYKAGSVAEDALYANDETDGTITSGVSLGKSNSEDGLEVTVKIWLQGWEKLGGTTALWDVEDYNGATFNVGLTFTCPVD